MNTLENTEESSAFSESDITSALEKIGNINLSNTIQNRFEPDGKVDSRGVLEELEVSIPSKCNPEDFLNAIISRQDKIDPDRFRL